MKEYLIIYVIVAIPMTIAIIIGRKMKKKKLSKKYDIDIQDIDNKKFEELARIDQKERLTKATEVYSKTADKIHEKVDSTLGIETNEYEIQEALRTIKGARGKTLYLYDNKVIIKTDFTLGSIVTKNATDGLKTIYFSDVIGVQFKRASTVVLGYIQLETASTAMNNKKSNFTNENSFSYDGTIVSNDDVEDVVKFINQKIEEQKSLPNGAVIQQVSSADELKKFKELLDEGVITKEEFEAKKKELLGL